MDNGIGFQMALGSSKVESRQENTETPDGKAIENKRA
jgi:hypothetical protein